eukprot:EG_transcript_30911
MSSKVMWDYAFQIFLPCVLLKYSHKARDSQAIFWSQHWILILLKDRTVLTRKVDGSREKLSFGVGFHAPDCHQCLWHPSDIRGVPCAREQQEVTSVGNENEQQDQVVSLEPWSVPLRIF